MARRTIRDGTAGLHADGPRAASPCAPAGPHTAPDHRRSCSRSSHVKRWRQLPGARDEAEQVAAFFEASSIEAGSLIDFDRRRDVKIHEPVTCADMRALLRDGSYDIVHFAGHGIFESTRSGDERVDPQRRRALVARDSKHSGSTSGASVAGVRERVRGGDGRRWSAAELSGQRLRPCDRVHQPGRRGVHRPHSGRSKI